MRRRFLVCVIAILATFSIALISFFALTVGSSDGLETVLNGQGVKESSPAWTALLNYGSDLPSALLMGVIGFVLVLAVTYGYLRTVSKRKRQEVK